MYKLVVSKGVSCWLVQLTSPNPHNWKVLGSASTEDAAYLLADEIKLGIMSSPVEAR